MKSDYYLTLLRGINVGGHNIIRMNDLKACFEDIGFADVATFIQSGNVLFRSGETDATTLVNGIERALSARFAYASRIVLLSYAQLARTVKLAPAGFGKSPEKYKYDVMFLRPSIEEEELLKSVRLKEGVDTCLQGKGVLYFSRLVSKVAQSHLSKNISLPFYQHMTVRNWNTTTKLLALIEGGD